MLNLPINKPLLSDMPDIVSKNVKNRDEFKQK